MFEGYFKGLLKAYQSGLCTVSHLVVSFSLCRPLRVTHSNNVQINNNCYYFPFPVLLFCCSQCCCISFSFYCTTTQLARDQSRISWDTSFMSRNGFCGIQKACFSQQSFKKGNNHTKNTPDPSLQRYSLSVFFQKTRENQSILL